MLLKEEASSSPYLEATLVSEHYLQNLGPILVSECYLHTLGSHIFVPEANTMYEICDTPSLSMHGHMVPS